MSGNHAPIPWTQYQLGTTIHGADGFYVGITQGTNAKGDAALIVAAVNSYASSQAEIERLRKALETIVDADTRPMYRNLETVPYSSTIGPAGELARAALGSQP